MVEFSFQKAHQGGSLLVYASNGGSGIYFEGYWLYTNWHFDWPETAKLHIYHKEAPSVMLVARMWGPFWSNNMYIAVFTDNITASMP